MKEILCLKCNTPISYKKDDYVYLCNYCSTTFKFDRESGEKVRLNDHYILPNKLNIDRAKDVFLAFLSKNYHKKVVVNKEFFIRKVFGDIVPCWVISIEANTRWGGHSEKKNIAEGRQVTNAALFAQEEGTFSSKYRWCLIARKNVQEFWGLSSLHQPQESVAVDWDGFSFDQNLGANATGGGKPLYDMREFFGFNFGKGVPILSPETEEGHAISKCKEQLTEFHRRLSKTMVDVLTDYRTDFEIAGIQLIHVPFWHVSYLYRPTGLFKFFYQSSPKWAIINGCTGAIIKLEFPIDRRDKVFTNMIVAVLTGVFFAGLGLQLSPMFFVLAAFLFLVAGVSTYKVFSIRKVDPDFEIDPDQAKSPVPDA